jgi:hypothetical protein
VTGIPFFAPNVKCMHIPDEAEASAAQQGGHLGPLCCHAVSAPPMLGKGCPARACFARLFAAPCHNYTGT